MDKSWLSSILPSLDSASHESAQQSKPRWHTARTAASVIIPVPILDSLHTSPESRNPDGGEQTVPVRDTARQHKQSQLETDLQRLLDMQASLLNATGTARSSTKSSAPDVTQIRKVLYSTIRKLAVAKSQELERLEPDLEQCEMSCNRLETICAQRDRFEAASKSDDVQKEVDEISRLRLEADKMGDDIREAEKRLLELRKTQRRLLEEAEEIESKVETRLSTYQRQLQALEAETTRIMPPQLRSDWASSNDTSTSKLDAAKDLLGKRLHGLQQQHERASNEYEALSQGAIIWRQVIKEVSEFEHRLAVDTYQQQRDLLEGGEDREQSDAALQKMRKTLQDVQNLITKLGSKLSVAEEDNWKLLICAIGAELEAARKGKEVLEAALADVSQRDDDGRDDLRPGRDGAQRLSAGSDEHDTQLDELERVFEDPKTRSLQASRHEVELHDDEDDDGPDPNLLIHQDSDHDS